MAAYPVFNGTETLLPAPEGWVVNFTHPYRNHGSETAIKWAFGIEFPIGTLFLIQRVYTALFVLRKFRVDDYMVVFAWLFTTTTQSLCLYCWNAGLVGLHAWEQPLDTTIYFSALIHGITLTAIIGTLTAKLVLCVFYYRLSPNRYYQWSIIGTGIVCIACFGTVWLAVMFACRPVAAAWNLRLATGTNCVSRPPFYLLQAIAGGVTDILLMIVPLPTIWGLQMPLKQKLMLVGWFSIGTITLAAAIMRLVSLLSMLTSSDSPWTMADAMLWLIVEANLIIMCACLPTLRVWMKHVFPRLNTQKKGSTDEQGSHRLRTFGAGSTKRQLDTIAQIERDAYFVSTQRGNRERDSHDSRNNLNESYQPLPDSGSDVQGTDR